MAEYLIPLNDHRREVLARLGVKIGTRKPQADVHVGVLDACLMDFSHTEPAVVAVLQRYGQRVGYAIVEGPAADLSLFSLMPQVKWLLVRDSSSAYDALADNAEHLPHVTYFKVDGRLRKEDAAFVIQAAQQWSVLSIMDLRFAGEGGTSLISSSARRWPGLTTLHLDNVDKKGIKKVFEAANNWPYMVEWHITGGNIDGSLDVIRAFAETSEDCVRVETIEFTDQGLGSFGLGTLVGRGQWNNLRTLDLSNNPLFDEGVRLIAQRADAWPGLSNLSLCSVKCRDAGVMELAAVGMQQWRHMMLLDLRGNRIKKQQTVDAINNAVQLYGRAGAEVLLDELS